MATKWWTAALVLGGLMLSVGCNPLGTLAFLIEPEHMVEPRCCLTDKEKEVKVVILCYHANLENRLELQDSDRELTDCVVKYLEERYKENKDKIKIVHPSQVRGYLSRHLDAHNKSPQEVGKHFSADFVINIEIGEMSLYERGSANRLYHGKTDLTLTVIDVHKPLGEGVKYKEDDMRAEFPLNRQYYDAGDMTWRQFRARFLNNVGRNIAQRFAAFPPKHSYDADGFE